MMVEFKEVVVPVDGSPNALRAAQFGARLAAAAGRPVRLLFVFSMVGDEIVGLAKLPKEKIEEAMAHAARRVFEPAIEAIGTVPVELSEVVLHGDPAEEILAFVDAHPEAHVVIGRRGKSPLERLLIGSVCDKVVRHAHGAITLV